MKSDAVDARLIGSGLERMRSLEGALPDAGAVAGAIAGLVGSELYLMNSSSIVAIVAGTVW
jgi:hypothetical protein